MASNNCMEIVLNNRHVIHRRGFVGCRAHCSEHGNCSAHIIVNYVVTQPTFNYFNKCRIKTVLAVVGSILEHLGFSCGVIPNIITYRVKLTFLRGEEVFAL